MLRAVRIFLIVIVLLTCHRPGDSVGTVGPSASPQDTVFAVVLQPRAFFMLPADPANPMTGSSTFGGRCATPATWISVFEIEGTVPQLGMVHGSASHCSHVLATPDHRVMVYDRGVGWLRNSEGEDLFIEYGDGVLLKPGADQIGTWIDHWKVTGGTGRFAGARGGGIDSGTVHMTTMQLPPYLMRGAIRTVNPAGRPALNLRGSITSEWSAPLLASGRAVEDSCARERGGGWLTNTLRRRGSAAPIGDFTFTGSYCQNAASGATGERRFVGTTASGDTFAWLVDEQSFDLPVLPPGLNRAYALRMHATVTGLTGALAGARGEIWGAGKLEARWDSSAAQPKALVPWPITMDWSGWLAPRERAR